MTCRAVKQTSPAWVSKRCLGTFTVTLVVASLIGAVVVPALISTYYFGLNQEQVLWLTATVGGNLAPLVVDGVRRWILGPVGVIS